MGKLIVLGLVGLVGILFFVNSWEEAKEKPVAVTMPEGVDISRAPRTIIDPFDAMSGAARTPDAAIERLTFFSTMQLGDVFRAFLDDRAAIIGVNEKRIGLPDFPANSSLRTEAELKLLHEYELLRTPERVTQIQEEVNLAGVKVGPDMIARYAEDPNYQLTGRAISQVLKEINPVIMRIKVKFDRVRPDKLDPTLTPLIDVPEHPAYPSGHSTQAHAVAFLLTALAPDQKAKFESDALRVAVNREIAGVHYPSDSAAGRLLARQIVDLMLRDRSFAALVESAKAEWPVNR